MAGNSFGQLFRITTFGESHGPGIGVVIDGCPSNLKLDPDAIQHELSRRRPGQSVKHFYPITISEVHIFKFDVINIFFLLFYFIL